MEIKSLKKTIGIVGGMGPHSGADLFREVLNSEQANSDQDYCSSILMSFPSEITDRTEFIMDPSNANPAETIVEVIRKLELVGADVIGIACNTAHSPLIWDRIQELLAIHQFDVTLVNMVEEVSKEILKENQSNEKVGILSTNGTYLSKVYMNQLEKLQIPSVSIDWKFQNEKIHRMIYDPEFGIKSNPRKIDDRVYQILNEVVAWFEERNVQKLILGCNELSLLKECHEFQGLTTYDSNQILAQALLKKAHTTNNAENVTAQLQTSN